ncbi:MAG TPA: transcriptional regulator [Rhodocyclaceae bacterium]|nr:hypothetical protein [Nitrospira sp.]HNE43409.1 transcriptional regulator [Rhodocyclaceae bacterium]HNL20747.1 transcriptional regulator [Rhodocyclaceae bacterium]HNM81741.1 transcriptional regulator [Rhodocyclaceae bacterium]
MNRFAPPGRSIEKTAAALEKLRKLLELFPTLPDGALVPIKLVQVLSGRGITSIRRDIAAGKLCKPTHIGPRCSRWPAGAVRQYISGN